MNFPLFARVGLSFPALFLSVAWSLGAAGPAQAQEAPAVQHPLQPYAEWSQLPEAKKGQCAIHPGAELSLAEAPALSIRNTLSIAEVQIASQSPSAKRVAMTAPSAPRGQIALGFYDVAHKVGSTAHMNAFSANGRYAACVSSFDAQVLSSPQITVARDFPAGSCSRWDVLNHEMIHYKIDQLSLARLKTEAPQIAGQFPSVYWGSTPEEAQGKVDEANRLFVSVLARRLSDLRTPLHAEHDSPEEYARESRSCSGATRHIAFAAMGLDDMGHPFPAPVAPQQLLGSR